MFLNFAWLNHSFTTALVWGLAVFTISDKNLCHSKVTIYFSLLLFYCLRGKLNGVHHNTAIYPFIR